MTDEQHQRANKLGQKIGEISFQLRNDNSPFRPNYYYSSNLLSKDSIDSINAIILTDLTKKLAELEAEYAALTRS